VHTNIFVQQISKDDVILGNFLPSPKVGTSALKELQARNVKVVFKKMVTSAETLPSGQTELTLSTGEKVVCDLYLAATGVTPNTSFMPKDLLNDRDEIVVDEHMKVKGANDIWSCGDAANIQAKKVMYAAEQAKYLGATLHSVLTTGGIKTPYKPDTKPMGAVTVGRAKGFGQMGSWSLPSFMVMFLKGKTMMVENLPKMITGAM
jgi:NADH dehydrogenase FAD-containing subunit